MKPLVVLIAEMSYSRHEKTQNPLRRQFTALASFVSATASKLVDPFSKTFAQISGHGQADQIKEEVKK